MRGKVSVLLTCREGGRITPAYAGKRSYAVDLYRREGDHPRLCGEKSSVGLCSDKIIGSPPPMRGKDIIRYRNR